jgi:hypothetical protein
MFAPFRFFQAHPEAKSTRKRPNTGATQEELVYICL